MNRMIKVLLCIPILFACFASTSAMGQDFDPAAISQVSKGLTDSKLLNQASNPMPQVVSGKGTGPGGPGVSALWNWDRGWDYIQTMVKENGTNPVRWPDSDMKRALNQYLLLKTGNNLNNCIIAENFLGRGVGHSPESCKVELQKGTTDFKGQKYDLIMASSSDGSKWDLGKCVLINQGIGVYNPELKGKIFIFPFKADFHSQFNDVVGNFNGKDFHIFVREVNFIAPPGGSKEQFKNDIGPFVNASRAEKATIYTGNKDNIAKLVLPNIEAAMVNQNTPGLKATFKFDIGPKDSNQVPIDRVRLNCDHPLQSYKDADRAPVIDNSIRSTAMENSMRNIAIDNAMKNAPNPASMGVTNFPCVTTNIPKIPVGTTPTIGTTTIPTVNIPQVSTPSMPLPQVRRLTN